MVASNKPPSEKQESIFKFVRGTLNSVLETTTAWPENPFKLRLEGAGIYQDFSGPAIAELEANGKIERDHFDGHRYLTKPGPGNNKPDDDIKEATEIFYDTLNNQHRAYFAECLTYAALSKIYETLRHNIDVDILPKGNYPRKMRGFRGELDGLVELRHELFPIEVYNGQKYMMGSHKKMGEATKLSFEEEPISNPLIISRISSEEARKHVFGLNGLIIDAGKIFICKDNHPGIKNALETLQITGQTELFSKMETSDGRKLDGETYHNLARDTQGGYSEITPTKMSDASRDISDEVLERFRGGIYLLYVNTFYRRANGRIERESCLVLQEFYNRLLRESGSTDYEDLMNLSWEAFKNKYPRIKNPSGRKESIIDQTRDYLTRLESEGMAQWYESGMYISAASHPNRTLSFSECTVTEQKI